MPLVETPISHAMDGRGPAKDAPPMWPRARGENEISSILHNMFYERYKSYVLITLYGRLLSARIAEGRIKLNS